MDGRKSNKKRIKSKTHKKRLSHQEFMDNLLKLQQEKEETARFLRRIRVYTAECVLAEMEIQKRNEEILKVYRLSKKQSHEQEMLE